ncbi:MAG: YdcH family protein [Pseudomonadota bacterium]
MSHTPHELAEEFPDKTELMSMLKTSDAHFARLFDEYHEVNRAVHRAETRVDAMSQEAEEELRRARMRLKDEIRSILASAPTT